MRWFFFGIWFAQDLLSAEGTEGTGAAMRLDKGSLPVNKIPTG